MHSIGIIDGPEQDAPHPFRTDIAVNADSSLLLRGIPGRGGGRSGGEQYSAVCPKHDITAVIFKRIDTSRDVGTFSWYSWYKAKS